MNFYIPDGKSIIAMIVFSLVIFLVKVIKESKKYNKEKIYYKDMDQENYTVRLHKSLLWAGLYNIVLFNWFLYIFKSISSQIIGSYIFVILLSIYYINYYFAWKIKVNKEKDTFIYRTTFWRTYEIKYSEVSFVKSFLSYFKMKVGNKYFFINKGAINGELFVDFLKEGTYKNDSYYEKLHN
jgi:hypothetical protein